MPFSCANFFTLLACLMFVVGLGALLAVWRRLTIQTQAIADAEQGLPFAQESLVSERRKLLQDLQEAANPVYPTAEDCAHLTRAAEANRISVRVLGAVTQVLLVWGIAGTLWSLCDEIPHMEEFSLRALRLALRPGVAAVSGYWFLLALKVWMDSRYKSLFFRLDALTLTCLMPELRREEAMQSARLCFHTQLVALPTLAPWALPPTAAVLKRLEVWQEYLDALLRVMARSRKALAVFSARQRAQAESLAQVSALWGNMAEQLPRLQLIATGLGAQAGKLRLQLGKALPVMRESVKEAAPADIVQQAVGTERSLKEAAECARSWEGMETEFSNRWPSISDACDNYAKCRRQIELTETGLREGLERMAQDARSLAGGTRELAEAMQRLQQGVQEVNERCNELQVPVQEQQSVAGMHINLADKVSGIRTPFQESPEHGEQAESLLHTETHETTEPSVVPLPSEVDAGGQPALSDEPEEEPTFIPPPVAPPSPVMPPVAPIPEPPQPKSERRGIWSSFFRWLNIED